MSNFGAKSSRYTFDSWSLCCKFNLHSTCHLDHPSVIIRKTLKRILPSTSEVWLFVYIVIAHCLYISVEIPIEYSGNIFQFYTWNSQKDIVYWTVLLLQETYERNSNCAVLILINRKTINFGCAKLCMWFRKFEVSETMQCWFSASQSVSKCT